MTDVLNPSLYSQLERYYGEVEIVAAGHPIAWRLVRERDWQGNVRVSRKVYDSGEEYRVRCRICRDHRARLHINHRWGVYDEATKSDNLWLINCFNEDCYDNFEAQQTLYRLLFRGGARRRRVLQDPVIASGEPEELKEVADPGPLLSLELLLRKAPNHQAIQYLLGRNLNPVTLSRLWRVGYCEYSRMPLASSRLIIPIYKNGIQVGWQARYPADDYGGVSFNEAGIPKYWTSPGYKRRLWAYNLERAVRHQTVVVVEGPVDVWNVGPMAVGLLGKRMNAAALSVFLQGIRANYGSEATVIVALDPKQDEKAKRKGKPHHIEMLYNQLFQPLQGRVLRLYLPEEFDPGSLDRRIFRDLCYDLGRQHGLPVSFGKPSGL